MLQYFKKIWYILGEAKSQVPLLLLVFIISSLTEAFGIGLLGPFFAIVSNPSSIQGTPYLKDLSTLLKLESDESLIVFLCVFIALVFIIKSVFYFLSKLYILKFSHSHRGKVVEKLNQAYLYSEYGYFISKNSSTLIRNIIVETQNFCSGVLLSLLYGISNLMILICLLGLMAFTDPLLLAGTLMSLLPVLILVYILRHKLRKWGKNASEATQGIIKVLNHGLGGFKETRIIGCSPYFDHQMHVYASQYARSSSLVTSFGMLPRILIELTLVIFIVSFIGISQFLPGRDLSSLIASLSIFAVASIRLLPAASQLLGTLGSIQTTRHVVDILYADLQEVEKHQHDTLEFNQSLTKSIPSASPLSFTNQIQLSNLSYRYSQELNPAIDHVSLNIRKGESIALIGKSGAGKTTLVDIILGLLSPQGGDIAVDGISIYQNLRGWQNLVGYIPQSIFLLDDTVERNIAFGVPDHLIDYQKLEEAISAAQLDELMIQLPKGIQTRVGERGVMLSGGQRQRIGIARALYHEREILVLDEATSALDNETEKKVSEAIQSLAGERTLIVIAHRLSTVEHCDRVYMLEKGKIVKSGKFGEVVSTKSEGTVSL